MIQQDKLPDDIKLILFDWDNTLIDSWGVIHHCFNYLLKYYGQEPRSIEETKARARASLRDSFPKIFGDQWQEARDIYYQEFQRKHIKDIKPLLGAKQLIDDLKNQGYTLGIISNKTHDYLLKEIKAMGWDDAFSVIIGATKADKDKPDTAPFELALSLLNHPFKNHEILYVGDTDIDIIFASHCEIHGVLIGDKKEVENLKAKPLSLHIFDNIKSFNSFILS